MTIKQQHDQKVVLKSKQWGFCLIKKWKEIKFGFVLTLFLAISLNIKQLSKNKLRIIFGGICF